MCVRVGGCVYIQYIPLIFTFLLVLGLTFVVEIITMHMMEGKLLSKNAFGVEGRALKSTLNGDTLGFS